MNLMKLTRRAVIAAVASAATVAALPAFSQAFPSRPIKIIVAFAPGGSSDTLSRLYGQKMSEILNTPVIIENRPGANQVTAIRALMASPPDGYTLYAATGSALTQNPALRKDLPYDPLKDFSYIGMAATNPGVIFVSNDLPVHSLPELFAYAKANPGKLNYGSAGLGTAGHLAAEALMSAGNFKMTHIPYKNDAEVIRETMSGSVHLGIFTTLNTVQPIKAGRIRGISVTTPKRLSYLPEVPGLSESKLGGLEAMDPHTFAAFVGPAGMPQDVVAKLNDAINKASQSPDVAARVRETLNAEPVTSTPASFRQSVEKQLALWRELGKTVKLSE
ncbi:tripartite tricarboxylate transporter substrate binding protein [Hydrogenophaga sp.]|uniref:Bug family tripartite tricarboxylate transporter substrate binding protein n=1 Tax=Hydrogenophaga sp. TaxID=1904254 RepID=UPI002721720E|nr:tripartite tricarboxylate transporter substrate binding protein [Hydrogenophaga sp.]MDO9437248.1 tripartite tricarboxylate transporter substrate binding protein [Hydrogenophaga sp.]